MSLTSGTRLGPYEIISAIGAGGMGEVYRARDPQLNRDVAIKIIPDLFALDPERLARFTREAQALAGLNHANIAHVYGVLPPEGGSHKTPGLVMELVEGEDLSAIIARGPLPLDEALVIARQIADALEAAHESGIVHRDLKPANVKVRPDGTVKVLDFGLAKAMDPPGTSSSPNVPNPANSPTFTARLRPGYGEAGSEMGVIMGTAAYMAPEQARGKAVDKRADIWAFGVVLFEMLTGRETFGGDTISDVMAAVMKDDPDWSRLPATTPPQIVRLLRRCLVKDPRQRIRDIGDARLLLDDTDPPAPSIVDSSVHGGRRPAPFVAPAAILLSLAAIAAIGLWSLNRKETPPLSAHLSIALPVGEQVTTVPGISPDGRIVAYASGRTRETSQLYLRSIDSAQPHAVEQSTAAQMPFFSPDNRFVAFFAGNKLWRAPVSGGAPIPIADAARSWGGSWCADGSIFYVPNLNSGVWRVSADGGKPVQLTKPDGSAEAGYAHTYPQCLPGTSDILFSFWGQRFFGAVLTPATGKWREISTNQAGGGAPAITVFASSGHILTGDTSTGITAAEWKPSDTTPVNPRAIVLDNVFHVIGNERIWLNVSDNGTVVYAPGSPFRRRLVWVDRRGAITPIGGDPDAINEATVSPDGSRIVRRGFMSQWIEDLATGTRTRILANILTWQAGWLPGEDRIVVSSNRGGDWDLYTVSAKGGGDLKPLLTKPYTQHPMSVAPDGSVLYFENNPVTGGDLWVLAPDGKTRPIANTPFNELSANVSPDNRYVAYSSDESGRSEVYAVPFSGAGDRLTVSTEGGSGPVWSRDGKELFYRAGDDLITAEILSMNPLRLGIRKKLLDVSAFEPGYFHDFDVSPDGQRFLFIRAEPESRTTRLDVILNWFPELRRLAQK